MSTPSFQSTHFMLFKYLEGVFAKAEEELKTPRPMNDFLQEIADDKVGVSPEEFRDYISALLELLFEKSKAIGAWAAVTDLDSAEGSIAVVNTGSVFYAVPFSSI